MSDLSSIHPPRSITSLIKTPSRSPRFVFNPLQPVPTSLRAPSQTPRSSSLARSNFQLNSAYTPLVAGSRPQGRDPSPLPPGSLAQEAQQAISPKILKTLFQTRKIAAESARDENLRIAEKKAAGILPRFPAPSRTCTVVVPFPGETSKAKISASSLRSSSVALTVASESETKREFGDSACLTGELGTSLPEALQTAYILPPGGSGELGRGAFARIRKVRLRPKDPLGPRKEFALKTIDKRALRIRGLVPQLKLEVDLQMRASSHPNILAMIDFYEESDFMHLILEYCPAYTLAHYRPPFPDEVVLSVLSQVAAALNFLHNTLNCAHRDVTPGNLMVSALRPRLIVKLGDFGWASNEAPLKGKAGTVVFMAPEVLDDGAEYSNAVDIYSLGRVLSYCTNSSLPSPGDKLQIYLNSHHRAMLNNDPNKRPTAGLLAELFTRFDVSGTAIQ